MKRLWICLLAMAVMAQIYGQEPLRKFTVMPRIGMTASTMWGEQATDSRLRIGAVAGADVEYRFSQKWGAQIGVEGLLIGSNIHSDVPNSANALLVGYIGVPVMADFHVTPRWTIKAGVEPAYRVKAGAKNGNRKVDFTWAVKKIDLTIPIGASFDITRHWVIDLRCNLGVRSIMKQDNITVRNFATALSAGFRF